MTDIDMNRLESVILKTGKHELPEDGMCFMEAIAWASGGDFTDFPSCVPREIARLGQRINDENIWDSDAHRTETLRPFYAFVLNAAHGPEARTKRGYIAAHFAVRRASDAARSEKKYEIADRLAAFAIPTNRDECVAMRNAAQLARDELRSAAYSAAAYAAYAAAYAADVADAAAAYDAYAADAYAAYAAGYAAKEDRRNSLLGMLRDFCEVKP